jgi:hypothetical protein
MRAGIRIGLAVIAICAAVVAAVACSGGSEKADAAVDALSSFCGHPGDTGNDIGVGRFCNVLSDCSSTTDAHICATLGDPMAHFCTKTCTMGSTGECGTDAMCICQGTACGCTPTSCLGSGSAN